MNSTCKFYYDVTEEVPECIKKVKTTRQLQSNESSDSTDAVIRAAQQSPEIEKHRQSAFKGLSCVQCVGANKHILSVENEVRPAARRR